MKGARRGPALLGKALERRHAPESAHNRVLHWPRGLYSPICVWRKGYHDMIPFLVGVAVGIAIVVAWAVEPDMRGMPGHRR